MGDVLCLAIGLVIGNIIYLTISKQYEKKHPLKMLGVAFIGLIIILIFGYFLLR